MYQLWADDQPKQETEKWPDRMKRLGETWRGMDPAAKQPWAQKHEDLMTKWNADMQAHAEDQRDVRPANATPAPEGTTDGSPGREVP
eukprot:251620-Karenia_brevis.AAC.1